MQSYPFAERRGALAQVDRNVKDFSDGDSDQLALWLLNLVMQTAKNALHRTRMVVLNERYRTPNGLFECLLVEAFKEKTAIVSENLGLKYDDVWNGEACCIHR
ncbi:hypothetical protein IBA8403_46930 [Pseudomonas syringae]